MYYKHNTLKKYYVRLYSTIHLICNLVGCRSRSPASESPGVAALPANGHTVPVWSRSRPANPARRFIPGPASRRAPSDQAHCALPLKFCVEFPSKLGLGYKSFCSFYWINPINIWEFAPKNILRYLQLS